MSNNLPECNVCQKTFRNSWNLKCHVKKFHPDDQHLLQVKKMSNNSRKCNVCQKILSNLWNLKCHVKKFHPDDQHLLQVKKMSSNSRKCNVCEKVFSNQSNLKYHVKTIHPNNQAYLLSLDVKQNKHYEYSCSECEKKFSHSRNLNFHLKTHNLNSVRPHESQRGSKKCAMCEKCNFNKSELLQHYNNQHSIEIKKRTLSLPTTADFYIWLENFEKETKSQYTKYKTYVSKKCKILEFVCNRSGTYKPKGKGERRLKIQGSRKIGGDCPASIHVKENLQGKSEINVTIIETHVGHVCDVGHLDLTRAERDILATKIASKIPFDDILHEVHESVYDNDLHRVHLLTKKDLFNIKNCYNLTSASVRHTNDAISVDSWIEKKGALDNDREVLKEQDSDNKLQIANNIESNEVANIVNGLEKKLDTNFKKRKDELHSKLSVLVTSLTCIEEIEMVEKSLSGINATLEAIKTKRNNFNTTGPVNLHNKAIDT